MQSFTQKGNAMKTNFRRFMNVALATAIALGAGFAVTPVSAQVRAAYVKNVDEPGRLPYQSMVSFIASAGSTYCRSAANCQIAFPVIPAGKRLIVESVSALVRFDLAPQTLMALTATPDWTSNSRDNILILPATWVSSGDSSGGFTYYSMQSTVRAYFEPGATPYVKIFARGGSQMDSLYLNTLGLNGYLIDAAN
jgi:hypothetical protein